MIYGTVKLLTYGAESWVLKETQEKQLQASEMKYLRRVLRVRRVDRKKLSYQTRT